MNDSERYYLAAMNSNMPDEYRKKLVFMIPVYDGEWRYCAAAYVDCLDYNERRKLVMSIPYEQGNWRYYAAQDIPNLTDYDRRELLMKLSPECGKWRYKAAMDMNWLSDEERKTLVMAISPNQGEWRYKAARYIDWLSNEDRYELVMNISPDQGEWRYKAAFYIPYLSDEDKRVLVMAIPPGQGKWRYYAACKIYALTMEERINLIMGMDYNQDCWRYEALEDLRVSEDIKRDIIADINDGEYLYKTARNIKFLSDIERKNIIFRISPDEGYWRYMAAIHMNDVLNYEERYALAMGISAEQAGWKYRIVKDTKDWKYEDMKNLLFSMPCYEVCRYCAARDITSLSPEDRRRLIMESDISEQAYMLAIEDMDFLNMTDCEKLLSKISYTSVYREQAEEAYKKKFMYQNV